MRFICVYAEVIHLGNFRFFIILPSYKPEKLRRKRYIMIKNCIENTKKSAPLIHCITNYVTVNDVANILLACGASPVMSDEPSDVGDIVSVANGLCLNIGTLNTMSIKAMHIAGLKAKELDKIVLLDPVGAGASKLRTDTSLEILETIKPDIIRCNISEIKALALGKGSTKGVDADISDAVTDDNLDKTIEFLKEFSAKQHVITAVTGKIDLVTDGDKCYVIRNGVKEMSSITGTGCMLSAIATAYASVNHKSITEAVASAVCLMGLAGEIAASNMSCGDGNSTLRNKIIDAVYNMTPETLVKGANYEIR